MGIGAVYVIAMAELQKAVHRGKVVLCRLLQKNTEWVTIE